MPGPIIDGERWIAERLAFLREQLEAGPPDEQRSAIEGEIETLVAERAIRSGRPGLGRFLRRNRSR